MEFNNENGAATKNETAKTTNNANTQNGAAKKESIDKAKPQNGNPKPEEEKPKLEPVMAPQQAKTELPLDARLRLVNDLHRRSVQRINLITRISQLEAFEVALLQENDELEENPYQGCKLIIRDDKNREFITTTPGLIRMVAQYIFNECGKKLVEIESTIIFPNV